MKPINLDNGNLKLTFNPESGALCGLSAPFLGWDILDRPELGLSFRLLVPLGEEKRNNSVFGERQKLTSGILADDGKSLTLVWDGVTSENTGLLSIKVTQTISLEGDAVRYCTEIENHTPYQVESVYSPYLGDVGHPPQAEWLKAFCYRYASANEPELWPHFHNQLGYFGYDYPSQAYGATPVLPFLLLRSENMGLYVGVSESSSELVTWSSELRPGWGSSIDARVPAERMLAGKPVHTRFAAIHMPYILPGETRSLTPISFKAYRGGWQQGVDIYKIWAATWLRACSPPKWASEPHAWQQIHINSPEDELRLRFTELPQVAAECARYGVKAIQLVGWNNGGQDQGNPSHDPDPRLGTFEELKSTIEKCQKLGVKVILFSKFTWADRATEWYRKELKRFAVKDPYGDDYVYGGYQYQTPAQFLDINTKRLIPMCFLSAEYRKLAQAEFMKLIDLGADGMLFDECQHHSPTLACFDETHGHRYGAPTYQNDRLFIEEMRNLPGVPEDFLMAGEACYNWELEQYQVAYHRSESKSHVPLSRYMLPEAQFMTAVTGFNDRNMINQCLMYRYIISYEPYNFKGRLPDFPDTMYYGVQMDALRKERRKWFWDGEFCGTLGAKAETEDGKPFDTFSVFRAQDDSIGIVLANYEDEPVVVSVMADNGRLTKYRLVDNPDWRDAGTVELPAQSAAVVI